MANNIWRYENYGTASLLKISGNTVTDLPASKSKTGSAFWQNQRVATFPIPATKELWVKFDLYYGNAQWRAYDRLNGNDTGVSRYQQANTITSFINGPLQYQLNPQNTLTNNQLKTYLLHMVSDAENGLVELWVDGVKYYSDDFASEGLIYKGNVEGGADFDNFYLQSASSANLFSNVIISNARIGLGENVIGQGLSSYLDFDIVRVVDKSIVPVSVDFDTVRDVNSSHFPLTLNFDIARDIRHNWRYENAGTADLLTRPGTTVTGLDSSQSKTGIAFYQPAYVKCFDIPATKEIWIKCDIFTTANYAEDNRIKIGSEDAGDFNGVVTYYYNDTLKGYRIRCNNTMADFREEEFVAKNEFHPILLHMVSDATNGIVELMFSNGESQTLTGNVNNGDDFANVYITMEGSNILVSNLIISNAPIDIDEDVQSYDTLDFDTVRYTANVVSVDFDIVRDVNSSHFPLTLNFDIARDIWRSWRYENYGSSALLVNDIQTTFEVPIEFSRTGFGYVPLENTDLVQFDVPAADDIWIKFDCFLDDLPNIYGENRQIKLGIGSRADKHFQKTGVEICFSVTDTTITAVDVLPISDNIFTTSAIKFLKIHRVMLHLMPYSMEVFIDNNVCLAAFSQSRTNFANFYIHWLSPPQVLPLISNIIISDKALNIFEDVSYISYPKNLVLDCGLYRDVHLGFWRYENFGTDELLIFPTQTFSDLPASKSKTGSAFIQNNYANCFIFPPTNEVWLQFDVYLPLTSMLFVGIRNPKYEGTGPTGFTGFRGLVAFWNYPNYVKASELNKVVPFGGKYEYYQAKGHRNSDKKFPTETLSTCLLHVKIGDDINILDGLIEFWVDGEKVLAASGNVNDGLAIDKLALLTSDEDDNHGLFSSIIISNAHPDFKLIRADLCRVLYSSNLFVLLADTARTLPHKIFSSPIEHSGDTPDIHNTSAGLQNFGIRLGEQQLTDFVNFTVTKPINIMEQVKGQYLDYLFDMRVESLKQRGILRTCNCCSDIDNLLYKQIEYSVPPNEQWHNPDDPFWQQHHQNVEDDIPKALASQHVNHIATVLGKQPVIRFADFVSTVDISAGGSTYADLIRNIFGWSSRIPHKMINCFLRNSYLYVIQRGFEDNLIDLSNAVIDIVSFDRELVRTTWGSSLWAKTEIRSKFLGWREVYNRDDYKAKKSSLGDANYSYDNDGLISHTSIYNDDGSTTYIDYQYKTLASGRKILVSESHSVFKDGVQIDYQQIIHTPLEQGQSHAMAIGQDGDYLGSNVGQSTGDDRVTPYEKFSRVLESVYADEQRTINGITLFDTSFPVYGDDKLAEITAAIRWLNRKTQETAILNLYDFPHVVDFNDRILLNGNEYYLKSNTTLQNTRIVNKQTLSLVRWF